MFKRIFEVFTSKNKKTRKIKLILCLLPVLFLLATLWLSGINSVQAASKDAFQKSPKPYFVKTYSKYKGLSSGWKDFMIAGKVVVPEPKIIRSAFQVVPEGGDFKCNGSCPAQTLSCMNGSITPGGAGCCIECCNSAGICVSDCCHQ